MSRTTLAIAAGLLAMTSPMALTAQAQGAGTAPVTTEPATSPEAAMPSSPSMDGAAAPAETMPMPSPETVPETVQVQANPRGSDEPAVTAPNPETASAPVAPAMPADPAYQAGAYRGALTAPPAEAMNKVYPLCTRARQDSCRNPGGV